jgi:hypothetical protein
VGCNIAAIKGQLGCSKRFEMSDERFDPLGVRERPTPARDRERQVGHKRPTFISARLFTRVGRHDVEQSTSQIGERGRIECEIDDAVVEGAHSFSLNLDWCTRGAYFHDGIPPRKIGR